MVNATNDTLKVTDQLMDRIREAAARAGANEFMGLLASRAGSPVVAEMYALDADPSPTHAVAMPLEIATRLRRLKDSGLVPRGLVHGHGRGGVFHSETDIATTSRLLPALAHPSFEAPAWMARPPTVSAPDEATLTMPDGQVLTFSLVGPEIPGADATEASEWTRVETSFGPAWQVPQVTLDGAHLYLAAGRVSLRLGIPEGARLVCSGNAAPVRVARVWSLVVNLYGELYAECLVVYDLVGHCLTERRRCEVEIVAAQGRDCGWDGDGRLPSVEGVAPSPTPRRPSGRRILAKLGL